MTAHSTLLMGHRRRFLVVLAAAGLSCVLVPPTATPVQTPPAPPGPCDDPVQQLTCYCSNHGLAAKVAGTTNIVTPCYPSSVQTPTPLLFGLFSVWSWTASNWPVTPLHTPDYAANFDDRPDHATFWETWKTSRDVFIADGRPPPPLDSPKRLLSAACRRIDVKAEMAKYPGWEKVPAELPPRYLPTYVINETNDYVADRNGQPVRVEITMNPTAFDYIFQNRLYSEDGQRAFVEGGGTIAFPIGKFGEGLPRGSHLLKAVWKVLGPNDDFDQYHKAWAYVEPWFERGTIVEDCRLAPVGLVAAHLNSKLDQAPKWSWATFEHERNAPLRKNVASAKIGQFNFFTPGCSPPTCAEINQRPQLFPPGGTHPEFPNLAMEQTWGEGEELNNPNTVGSAVWANQQFAEQLKNSVFVHYKLKGTQWFDDSKKQESPRILANTLLEAYSQTTSTCLGCHQTAGLTGPGPYGERVGQKYPSDFVFVLNEAKPEIHVE